MKHNLYNPKTSLQQQQGTGLIEVLVSLLLLAIAMMGFAFMKTQSLGATDESLMRTRALSVIRGGAELMRANPEAIEVFAKAVNNNVDSSLSSVTVNSCVATSATALNTCNVNQLATRDGKVVRETAQDNGFQISMNLCPGTDTLQCFIVSWKGTKPEIGSDADQCLTATGVMNPAANCLVMEAY